MIYSTKFCPFCKHPYSFMQPKNQVSLGSPIRICEKCKKTFIDKDFVEIGKFGNENLYYPQKVYPGTIILFIMSIIFAGMAIWLIETFYVKIIVSLLIICGGIFLLYCDISEYDKSVEEYKKELEASK